MSLMDRDGDGERDGNNVLRSGNCGFNHKSCDFDLGKKRTRHILLLLYELTHLIQYTPDDAANTAITTAFAPRTTSRCR